jgi:hypothetical protein
MFGRYTSDGAHDGATTAAAAAAAARGADVRAASCTAASVSAWTTASAFACTTADAAAAAADDDDAAAAAAAAANTAAAAAILLVDALGGPQSLRRASQLLHMPCGGLVARAEAGLARREACGQPCHLRLPAGYRLLRHLGRRHLGCRTRGHSAA